MQGMPIASITQRNSRLSISAEAANAALPSNSTMISALRLSWLRTRDGISHSSTASTAQGNATKSPFCVPVTPKVRSEEHTSELQSLMRISYAVSCFKNKNEQIGLGANYADEPEKDHREYLCILFL